MGRRHPLPQNPTALSEQKSRQGRVTEQHYLTTKALRLIIDTDTSFSFLAKIQNIEEIHFQNL